MGIKEKIRKLDVEIASPQFWNNNIRATEILKNKTVLEKPLSEYEEIEEAFEYAATLLELIDEEIKDGASEEDMSAEIEELASA